MRGQSFFMEEENGRSGRGEKRLCIVSGAALNAAGLLLLAIPALQDRGAAVLAEGWVLLTCVVLSFVRPIFFSRGFADLVMGAVAALFYAAVAWSANTADISGIADYRTLLGILLLFTGLSRILAFARLLDRVPLPLLLIEGFAEAAAAGLILLSLPSADVFFIYWLIGLLLVLNGFEEFSEALKLSHRSPGNP